MYNTKCEKTTLRARFALSFLFLLSFCGTLSAVTWERYHYESYGSVDLTGATIAILPADESIVATDPRFVWYAQQTVPYFELFGAEYVTNVDEAELVLLLDFGIGETTPRVYNTPIWGRTGISSSSTTIRGNKINTTYTPSYGVIGYQQNSINQYRKHIEMYLYDANTENGMSMLWQGAIELVGSTSNLQNVYSAMLCKMAMNAGLIKASNSGNMSLFDYNCNTQNNLFLAYASKAIAEDYVSWRYLWRYPTTLTQNTFNRQKEKQSVVLPKAIVPGNKLTRIYFDILSIDKPTWKLSDLSNIYIEYRGKRYSAQNTWGLKKNKSIAEYGQRTFAIDFEPLPETFHYGPQDIRVIEEKKGKVLQGWDLKIEQ